MTVARLLVALAALVVALPALAQVTPKPDGQWRAVLAVGFSVASGNTESALLNVQGETVRATESDRFTLAGVQTYGEAGGTATADLANLAARYMRDIDPHRFGFLNGELARNELANLALRSSLSTGLGHHVVKSEMHTFDVFGGIGVSEDRYVAPVVVAGELRERYRRWEPVIGEESTHRLTPTTMLRQRLAIFPNATDTGEFRATFDAGVAVAMTNTLSLTATLAVRHNSDPGAGLRTTDALLVTGIAYKLE